MGWWTVYYREMFLMNKKIGNLGYVFSTLLYPLLYLFAFSWGFGATAGVPGGYVPFLSKGMLGIAVMLNSFQQTAISVSVGRFYFRSFQTLLVSPLTPLDITLGVTLAGVSRGVLAGGLIYAVSLLAFAAPPPSLPGMAGIIISAACFGAFGFTVGLWADNQDALSMIISFVITPMTFFCGSFFPIERLPPWLQGIAGWLPLSISNKLLRSDAWTLEAALYLSILSVMALSLFYIGVRKLNSYSE
jgi:ABC-type multidrug transport system permease subunit